MLESLNVLFLVDTEGRLKASVPLARIFLARGEVTLASLAPEKLRQARVDEEQDRAYRIVR